MAKKNRKRIRTDQFKGLQTIKVEVVPIDKLKPNSYNPNRQSDEEFELLKTSISSNGFSVPIVVQREDMVIVDGEHRWRAARELGYTEIPVIFSEYVAEQMRLATLQHNRARGQENLDMLSGVLSDLESLGALDTALAELDMDQEEARRILDSIPITEQAGDGFTEAWVPTPRVDTDDVGDQRMVAKSDSVKALQERQREEINETGFSSNADVNRQVWRLNLVYTSENAALVKAVLGDDPGGRLLEVSRKYMELEDADRAAHLWSAIEKNQAEVSA